jgi:SAM-dependent methyltransferase
MDTTQKSAQGHLTTQGPINMNTTPWYKTFFNEDYVRVYSPFLTAERTAQEVAAIIHFLELSAGSAVLDLCCGYGRHAIPLAQQGYNVVGLDLSEVLLQLARTEADTQEVKIRWIQGDMRTIPFESTLDAVINMFTSFGYLSNEAEDLQVLAQVYKALKPGGRFLLETVHQPRVIQSFSPYGILHYDDGLIVLEERRIDLVGSRNEVHITLIFPDGKRSEYHQSMRIYTLTELIRMLTAVGLEVQAYHGGLNGGPVTLDSRLVIISQKPG